MKNSISQKKVKKMDPYPNKFQLERIKFHPTFKNLRFLMEQIEDYKK